MGEQGKTTREIDGRLFREIEAGPFTISSQAGRGYQSNPAEDLPHLEDYEAVEVAVFCPGRREPVDPTTLGLPEDLANRFPALTDGYAPSIAGFVPRGDLPRLREALIRAAMASPNAGYPPGRIGWAGRIV